MILIGICSGAPQRVPSVDPTRGIAEPFFLVYAIRLEAGDQVPGVLRAGTDGPDGIKQGSEASFTSVDTESLPFRIDA